MTEHSKTDSPGRFTIISLGCAKNTVDAYGMATLLERSGYEQVDEPQEADLVIVNTCGFIEAARDESLSVLRELSSQKRVDQSLLVAGCWSQRDPDTILETVQEVDGLLGTRRWMDIVKVVQEVDRPGRQAPIVHLPDVPTVGQERADFPRAAIQGASAYLKIADGCSRACSFCAIPLIKGPAVSQPMESVLKDAEWLALQGVKEIILIAQDTTSYGKDLGIKDGLSELLLQMVGSIPQLPWIRVMYAFPGAISQRLIDVIADHQQVLPYVDIPLQHAHPDVLRRMRRPSDMDMVRGTVSALRERIPEIAIRTTFIVGYPGETDEEFAELVSFVEEMAFDRVGVFIYSEEVGTGAADMPDDIPTEEKEERQAYLMEIQQGISLARNQTFVGNTMDVLIEGLGDGLSVGRSYRDGPEIDGLVLVNNELQVGEMALVRITQALEYDLIGEVV
jgi:ribosomal protein S12 methylthiotransferase